MTRPKRQFFRVIYYDRDARTFNVSEVMSDDRLVTDRTVELQRSRQVNITSTNPETDPKKVPSLEKLLTEIPAGYRHDPKLRW